VRNGRSAEMTIRRQQLVGKQLSCTEAGRSSFLHDLPLIPLRSFLSRGVFNSTYENVSSFHVGFSFCIDPFGSDCVGCSKVAADDYAGAD
jgi:hypothetical protein